MEATTATATATVSFWLTCPTCAGSGEVQPGCDPQVTRPCTICAGRGAVSFEDYDRLAAELAEITRRPAAAARFTDPEPF